MNSGPPLSPLQASRTPLVVPAQIMFCQRSVISAAIALAAASMPFSE